MKTIKELLQNANEVESNQEIEALVQNIEQLSEKEFLNFFEMWDKENKLLQEDALQLIQTLKKEKS